MGEIARDGAHWSQYAMRKGKTTCRHHWLIETPNGPTCRGRCRACGAEREFPTVPEDNLWLDVGTVRSEHPFQSPGGKPPLAADDKDGSFSGMYAPAA